MKKLFLALAILLLTLATSPAELERVAFFQSATTSGTVEAGFHKVTFIFGGTFAGTIGGMTFTASDYPLTIEPGGNDRIGAIPYTVSNGTLRIVKVP